MRSRNVYVITACAAMMLTGSLGYALGTAQMKTEPIAPVVLSGEEIGFRMVGRQGNRAVGVIVVKVNGEWVATAPQWDTIPTAPKREP